MLQVIYKELMAVFIACVTQALYRLGSKQLLLVAETTEFQLVRRDMLGKITGWNAWWPSLQHDNGKTSLRSFLGNPATTSARANHQHIVKFSFEKRHAPESLANIIQEQADLDDER
jgi:ABC-type nickel/cobalt efflux system permease component RcnA